MAKHGTGLSDTTRTWVGIAFSGLLALNTSLAGLAIANAVTIDPGIFMGIGIATVIIYAIKDKMGIRDSTSAGVAKVVDADSNNVRDTTDSVNNPPAAVPPTPPV